MMIFWKAGLVFLSVPKTGTHAWHQALGAQADIVLRHPQGVKHMNARRFRREFRPLIDPDRKTRLEMMAVIRDPVDWLGSWYRYRARPELSGTPRSTENVDFDDFVLAYLSPDPPAFAALGSQVNFVSNRQGKVIVKHLFAYEDIPAVRSFLTQRLDADIPELPRLNTSPVRQTSLSNPVLEQLKTAHPADFALHAALTS